MSSSASAAPVAAGSSAIQVVVRLRPMNALEERHGTLPVVTARTAEKTVTVVRGKGRKQQRSSYTFDDVFSAFATQEEVFDATVRPVVADVLRGFEATVFAYGQTGTGKTHTMEGSLERPELYGVIPRSAQAIFEALRQPRYRDERVTCSCLEIYNEELRDLLVDNGNDRGGGISNSSLTGQHHKLDIMEGKDGTFCRGLTEKTVRSASDVLALLQKAQHSRMIGETRMNKASSRSHCLFTLQVSGKVVIPGDDGDLAFSGKLHLVDLAGSECAKAAGHDKHAPDAVARERERMNINRSLLTLGRVITILKEKSLGRSGGARIPYRDSKLTRVLQEALGGKCKTVIVANISPSITAIEESISSLNYAHAATGIINKPVSSSLIALGDGVPGMGKPDLKSPPTVESWQEMEMRLGYMQTQVDEAQAALARKHLQQQELQDRADKAEEELLVSQQKLFDATKEIEKLKGVVDSETKKRKQAEAELGETKLRLKKTEVVLKATQATESSLTTEAQTLIGKLEEMVRDRNDMHALVVAQRNAESERRRAAKQFQEAALLVLNEIETSFSSLSGSISASQSSATEIAAANHDAGRRSVAETQKLLSDIAKNVVCVTDSMKAQLAGEGGLVPAVQAGSSAVLRELQSANDEFVRGEKALGESQMAMRKRLDECTKALEERASAMQTSTGQALQSFETKVVESKNAISHLVMRLKGSLSNLAEAKAEKAQLLDSLVEQWRDQSLTSSKAVLEASSTGSASLKSSMGAFDKEMHHHDEMSTALETQRAFLDNTGAVHVNTIGEQGSLLTGHRRNIVHSRDSQAKLHGEVMQTILQGVQTLVSTEMEKLASAQANHFQVLDGDGATLARANEVVTQSAKQVVDSVQATNALVLEKASAVRSNDMAAGEAMRSAQSVLEGVTATSNAHHELTTDLASKSLGAMSQMKQLDGQNAEVVKMAERDGKATSTTLVNSVFKPTSASMKQTLQSSLEALSYVNGDVVPKVSGDLENAAKGRQAVAQGMGRKLGGASTQLSSMAGQVASAAKAQHEAAGNLGSEITAASDKHAKESVPRYYAELDSGKERLASTLVHLVEASNRTISEGKSQGVVVKQSVEDFAHNKMQCIEPVDPAPARKDCNFSHQLSSTPAEDVLLKGVDLGVAAQGGGAEESSTSEQPAAAARSESPLHRDADSSRETQEDDNDDASRRSCGSMSSLPSPRLKYRDVNVKQQGDSGRASGSNARKPRHAGNPASSTNRKNKCPSGLMIPSKQRKRTKR